jgi:hypothetical protein
MKKSLLHVLPLTIAVFCFAAPAAHAACWQLPNGTTVETVSRSAVPAKGAKRVSSKLCVTEVSAPTKKLSTAPAQNTDGYDIRKETLQCVPFVRTKQKKLPMSNMDDSFPAKDHKAWKVSLIDSRISPNDVKRGYVAIMTGKEMDPYGHMAYVVDAGVGLDPSPVRWGVGREVYWITIEESNFPNGSRRSQKKTAHGNSFKEAQSKLGITGYWKP